jgi:CBS domain-containing protein
MSSSQTTSGTDVGSFRSPRMAHARVRDAMHPGVITVPQQTPLREVARVLASKHIHCLLVDGRAELGARPRWSLVSAMDLLRARASADERSFEDRTVSSNDELERAARVMAEQGAEHVLVLAAEDGHPVGVLSTLDVAGILAWGEA